METGTYVATYVTVSTETGTYVGTRLRGDGHIRRYPSPRRRSHTYVFVSKRMPVQSVGSDCKGDHLVAQWEKWVQKLHFYLVQPVYWTIWWPNSKMGAEIALFESSASIVDHLVAQE